MRTRMQKSKKSKKVIFDRFIPNSKGLKGLNPLKGLDFRPVLDPAWLKIFNPETWVSESPNLKMRGRLANAGAARLAEFLRRELGGRLIYWEDDQGAVGVKPDWFDAN